MNRTQAERRHHREQAAVIDAFLEGSLTFEEAVKKYPYSFWEFIRDWFRERSQLRKEQKVRRTLEGDRILHDMGKRAKREREWGE